MFKACNETLCRCTSIIKIPLGKVIEFVLINQNDAAYSFHMHGTSFRVLGSETLGDMQHVATSIEKQDSEGLLPRLSPDRALIKDTINVPELGYVIIRWKADNPGYWFFHSLPNSHLETGQATILQVGETYEIPKPPSNMPSCGAYQP